MNTRLPLFAGILLVIAGLNPGLHGEEAKDVPSIEQLLSLVPENAAWQDLAPDLQANFEKRAVATLALDRQSWGLPGLRQKADILFSTPTPAMTENIDRILSITFKPELPGGFVMSRDVSNADLKRMLILIYLTITDDRGFMLQNHPKFKAWDGLPIKELQFTDHEHSKAMTVWLQETEDGLRKIPDESLTPLEKALRTKSYFTTRAGKHFDKPAVGLNGAMGYTSLYALAPELRPFLSDTAFLEAHNASMFTEFRDVNVGTLDTFELDYESEFNRTWLAKQGMSDALATNVLKLGSLYRTRTRALPGKDKRCTIFSPAQQAANWDSFTAGQISNADGSETMQSYAKRFDGSIAQRLVHTRQVGIETLERLFPDGSADLTPAQRAKVADRLLHETRPAKMLETMLASLDEVTGSTVASAKVNDTVAKQPSVGGNYSPGQPVRDSDRAQLVAMWNKIRAFIKREYSGYRVDIAALVPAEPILVPSGDLQFTVGGEVNLSLGSKWNTASLSSTIMHEIKHAIDQNSHAAVEGAAWEGAATSIERQVWPIFIEEAMADQTELLPTAKLITEIDNVRFTATTDATLKVFLRESCAEDEPDTNAFAEEIVRGYGYDDPEILHLRSRRAHRGTQYLQYDYGLAMYADLLAYLQSGIGPTPRVDAYLLQACGMPSPKKEQAAIDDLRACIRVRKS